MRAVICKLWKYLDGISGLLLILYLTAVSAAAAIVNAHYSSYYLAVTIICTLVLSGILCPPILRFLSKVSFPDLPKVREDPADLGEDSPAPLKSLPGSREDQRKGRFSLPVRALFFVLPLLVFLPYFFAYYPGGLSTDSIDQLTQALSGRYNDWHPVIQTLLSFKLPLVLTGGWVGAPSLFQIILFCAVLGYVFNTVLEYTNLQYALISLIFVVLHPQLGYLIVYPWKDVPFTIGTLILTGFSLRICFTEGRWLASAGHTCLFILTAALTTLVRHNGLLFTIPLVFAVLFFIDRKKGLAVCAGILVICLGIRGPVYSALQVESPDQRQVETLGLPMTVIGGVVTYEPDKLDPETKEFAYRVAPGEVWQENYQPGTYNYVKWDSRTNNLMIEEYGAEKVLRMMVSCFRNARRTALVSLLKLTEASYTLTDPYNFIFRPIVTANDLGISQTGSIWLQNLLMGWTDFASGTFPHLFMYPGVMFLVLIVSALSRLRLRPRFPLKRILFLLPVFSYNYGTSLLLTGYDDTSRFFLYVFQLTPLLLVFLFRKEADRS